MRSNIGMDSVGNIIDFVKDLTLLLLVFGGLFAYSLVRGQRALLALILGLYLALLISLEFPYYQQVGKALSFLADHTMRMVLFAFFTAFASFVFERLLSRLFDFNAVESFTKRVILSILATILIMAYSYHVIPVTELIDPGVKVSMLFASDAYFFWWLMLPLVSIMFVF